MIVDLDRTPTTCGTCRWFHPVGSASAMYWQGNGHCRANPPVLAANSDGMPQTRFPLVTLHDWCAMHEWAEQPALARVAHGEAYAQDRLAGGLTLPPTMRGEEPPS